MDMLQLETFVSLVQHGNFSRAAKELGVSQPTVTIRIKALEDALETPLIRRVGHKIQLTNAGQTFYDHIERSLRVLREGIDSITSSMGPNKIRLPISGTSNLCTYVIPKLLGRVYRFHPTWDLSLLIGHSWEVAQMVLDEVSQIGFINGHFHHPDVSTIPLFNDPFYLVSHPEHHLAQKESITLFDLTNESLFTYKLESNMSYMIKNLFRDIRMKTDLYMELNDSYTMKRMVQEGNGLGFMPWSAAEKDVEAGKLAILPIELPTPLMREVNLIVLNKNISTEPVSGFLSHLFSFFDQLPNYTPKPSPKEHLLF